jgi:hypothetical protein
VLSARRAAAEGDGSWKLEFYRELAGHEMFAEFFGIVVRVTVLHLHLQVVSETITERGVDARNVVSPL